ncbi:MAG TPA: YfhO family protein, partial [Bacteroidota bacterium]|nr:YfhO family protein [Bacteroidota bacterium]
AKANSVRIRAVCPVSALLVLSDTYYPGWEAEIDGKPARILLADHTMRAVVVPPGVHEVAFEFRPGSVRSGFMLSLVALVSLALIALPRGRRPS